MTGVAVVNSPHAFHNIRQYFVENYLIPDNGKQPSYNMNNAWQTVTLCKATTETCHGQKMSAKDIHIKTWRKCVSWSKIMCEDEDAELKIDDAPECLSEDFFLTSDTKNKKRYVAGVVTDKKLWKKWGTVKLSVINFDNDGVKKIFPAC